MFENERVEDLFDEDDVGDILDRYGFRSISKKVYGPYFIEAGFDTRLHPARGGDGTCSGGAT
jgi:hypothetical protein